MKLEKLTPGQVARFPEFIERWTKIGLSCEPCDFAKAKDAVVRAYAVAGLRAPKLFVVADSPISGAIISAVLKTNSASVRDSVWASVWASVRDSVGASVWASVGDSVWDSVEDSVGDSVWASVRDSVRDSVWDSVWDSVRASVLEQIWGPHEAGWLSFYSFFLEAAGLTNCEKLRPLMDLSMCCGWWAPYAGAAILQHRHCELHRNSRGRLHNERGMAVKYRDGWGVWALNGVRVPEWLVLKKAEDLVFSDFTSLENAEHKREFVRKVGVERMLNDLGSAYESVASSGDYTLFRIDLGTGGKRTYLKMRNPSIGVWHVEPVHPACRTVQHALNYRRFGTDPAAEKKNWKPEIVT